MSGFAICLVMLVHEKKKKSDFRTSHFLLVCLFVPIVATAAVLHWLDRSEPVIRDPFRSVYMQPLSCVSRGKTSSLLLLRSGNINVITFTLICSQSQQRAHLAGRLCNGVKMPPVHLIMRLWSKVSFEGFCRFEVKSAVDVAVMAASGLFLLMWKS